MSLPALDRSLTRYQSLMQNFPEAAELSAIEAFRDLLERRPDALLRSCEEGHVTGSALVINPAADRVLLMLHAKLGKWLQLGGHVDGECDVAAAALREAQEESGQPDLHLLRWESISGEPDLGPAPFDLDIHEIPARPGEGAHKHYDLRYLVVMDDALPIVRNSESKDLRWLTLPEARALTQEESMLRQFRKLEFLAPRIRDLTQGASGHLPISASLH